MTFLRLCALVAVFGLMFSEGLHLKPGEGRWLLKRGGLLFRSVVCVVLMAPVAAWVAVRVFQPAPEIAVVLAVLSAAPLCPFVFLKIAKVNGDRVYGRSLHLVLAILAVFTTPLVLAALGWGMGVPMRISVTTVGSQVLLTILLPMALGMLVHLRARRLAEKIRLPLARASSGLLVLLFAVVGVTHLDALAHVGVRGYLAILAFLVLGLAFGHAFGGRQRRIQTTLALETAARNPALAIAIGTVNFPESTPAALLLPDLLCLFLVIKLYSMILKKRAGATHLPEGVRA